MKLCFVTNSDVSDNEKRQELCLCILLNISKNHNLYIKLPYDSLGAINSTASASRNFEVKIIKDKENASILKRGSSD